MREHTRPMKSTINTLAHRCNRKIFIAWLVIILILILTLCSYTSRNTAPLPVPYYNYLSQNVSYPANILIALPDECPLSESELKSFISPTASSLHDCHSISMSFNKNIICPNNEQQLQQVIEHGTHREKRYLSRAKDGHCDGTFGMWRSRNLLQQKCFFLSGMKYMNIKQSQIAIGNGENINAKKTFLDWGTGCSHQIFWLYQYYGHCGFGLDLIESNKQYAMHHFYNNGKGPIIGYCSGSAINLAYIPNNTFDYIISIAAVYHLEIKDQCKLVLQHFIRIIKPGGTIWIGWNGGDVGKMTKLQWKQCLDGYDANLYGFGEIEYEIIGEMEAFGYTYYPKDNPYSVFVTRKLDE